MWLQTFHYEALVLMLIYIFIAVLPMPGSSSVIITSINPVSLSQASTVLG